MDSNAASMLNLCVQENNMLREMRSETGVGEEHWALCWGYLTPAAGPSMERKQKPGQSHLHHSLQHREIATATLT